MKMKILHIALLCLCSACFGKTIVHVGKGNSAERVWLIGIFETEQSFLPVVAGYQWGIGLTVISVESIRTDLEFPSILLAQPSNEIPGRRDYPLYIQGEVTPQGFDFKQKEWIHSRYLGWVFVRDYPTVFSPYDGWLYINRNTDGLEVYNVYSYRDQKWLTYDLRPSTSWDYSLLGNKQR
jgi:hypothetical protein